MKEEVFKYIAREYGTPSFLFDEKILSERMCSIREIFDDRINLCYSVKANPFVIPLIDEHVKKHEVCSPGELDICKSLGVLPEKILYSGVNKGIADISDAMQYGVVNFTAESIKQVKDIDTVAKRRNQTVNLLIRLNAGSQFGMSKTDICYIIKNFHDYTGLNIEGIHYHSGTQRKKISEHIEELNSLKIFFDEINNIGKLQLTKLEYGPGLFYPYFENEDFSDTLKPVKDISSILNEIADWCDITVEMGRFFVSSCGAYLTSVADTKENLNTNYCILDGGINHLNYYGQILGMKIPQITHIKTSSDDCEEKDWCLCGSLCTLADVIVKKINFSGLKTGDYLVFKNVGAYSVTEGISLFLSRTMPRILIRYKNDSIVVAREFLETSKINTISINKKGE